MSCCGSLFVNLGGGGGGGTVNTGVLQIAGGVALDSTLRFVEDQNGTDSVLKLSTTGVDVGTFVSLGGTNDTFPAIKRNSAAINFVNAADTGFAAINSGPLSVTGLGGDLAVFFNNSNEERLKFDGLGGIISQWAITAGGSQGYRISGKLFIQSAADGQMLLTNSGGDNFERINFGGNTNAFPAIKRSGINIEVRVADDTQYGGITAGRSTEKTLEVIEVSGAMGLGFYNAPAIIQPVTGGSSASYASVSGSEIKENDTFDGYTVGGVVKALRNLGLLA
jgi:hypothetical protein